MATMKIILSNLLLIAVVTVGGWFGVAREKKTLSTSDDLRVLPGMDLSGKGFKMLEDDTFDNCTGLETLDLTNNSLSWLPEYVFSPLEKLTYLNVSGNYIEITRNAFVGLKNLKILDISNNSLRAVSSNFFAGLTGQCLIKTKHNPDFKVIYGDAFGRESPASPRINMAMNDSSATPKDTESSSEPTEFEFDACLRESTLVKLNVRSKNSRTARDCYPISIIDQMFDFNELTISKVERGWYRVADDVTMSANISGMRILRLESADILSDILNEIPVYFNRLHVEYSPLTRSTNSTLKHNGLIELNLGFPGIESVLEPVTFDFPKLKKLSLGVSPLVSIDLSATLPPTLEWLRLKFQSTGELKANSFPHLKNLKTLSLHNFGWLIIDRDAFNHLDNLEELFLWKIGITDVEPGTFDIPKLKKFHAIEYTMVDTEPLKQLPSTIEELDLESNKITTITANSISHLKNLKKLVFDFNEITTIEPGAFIQLENLEELSLPLNNLIDIEPDTFYIPKLRKLNLDHNQLADTNSLSKLPPTIEELELRSNMITTITVNSFSHLKNLKKLFLTENEITTIELHAFELLDNLEELQLDFNSITVNKPGTFDSPKLRILNLNDNALNDSDLLYKLPPTIEELDLGSNEITTITANFFSHLKNLEKLNFYKNKITTIELSAFENLHNLKFLNLGANYISRLDARIFTGLKNLQELSLRSNAITIIEKGTLKNSRQLCRLDIRLNPIHKLGNGELFGLQKTSSCYVNVTGNELEVIEGGVFNDV